MNHANILAIDTSCDDTSAAVTQGLVVRSNVIASQTELHKPYGGVFPTVAKMAHKENIDRVVALALQRAQVSWSEIEAVAVTVGPGLAPALEVGIAEAKQLATDHNLPLIPVNHIEGHLLSVLAKPAKKSVGKSGNHNELVGAEHAKIEDDKQKSAPQLPALSVIVSGGHTEFVLVHEMGKYEILGATLDDAAGECLDKIGRMLNLGYPAGPVIEQFAKRGNADRYEFPLPLTQVKNYDLSFSGLKTFTRNFLEAKTKEAPMTQQEIYDFCASAQYGVFRHICYKLNKILEVHGVQELWLGGGVAANMKLRTMLRQVIKENNKNSKHLEKIETFRVPYTKKLCMDNAAMIGLVAGTKMSLTKTKPCSAEELEKIERQPRLAL